MQVLHKLKPHFFWICIIILNLVVFHRAFLDGDKLLCPDMINDVSAFFYSCWLLNADTGGLPWNPWRFCGMPWGANPQNLFYYPPYYLFLRFLTPIRGINLCFALHIMLAGLGMYGFGRALKINPFGSFVSGIVYMFCPMVFLRVYAGHVNTIAAFAYFPLIFMFAQKAWNKQMLPYSLAAGVALALQIQTGNPQFTYYTILALGFYGIGLSIYHKNMADTGLSLLIILTTAIVFSLHKLIPNLELASLCTRSAKSFAFAASWSLPPENLLTIFFPRVFGNMLSQPYLGKYLYWEMCAYIGILPLILALLARGKNSIILKIMALTALVSALGVHTPLFSLYAVCLPGFTWFRGHNKFLLVYFFAISILSGLGVKACTKRSHQCVIVIILLLELLYFGWPYLKYTNPKKFLWDQDIVSFLKSDPELFRVEVLTPDGFYANNASIHKIAAISAYDPLKLKAYNTYFNQVRIYQTRNPNIIHFENLELLSAANLKYFIVPKNMQVDGCSLVFQGQAADVLINHGCFPRAYIINAPDDLEINFNPLNTKISKAVITNYQPLQVNLTIIMKEPGFLILADAWYPEWQVYVSKNNSQDFNHKKIVVVNGFFRGVFLEQGEFKISFRLPAHF